MPIAKNLDVYADFGGSNLRTVKVLRHSQRGRKILFRNTNLKLVPVFRSNAYPSPSLQDGM